MPDNCPSCGGRLSEFMDWALMRYFRLCRSCAWTDRPGVVKHGVLREGCAATNVVLLAPPIKKAS
jgi:hypothetical protein